MSTATTWARGPYSARGVVGVLTPPANTTVEPEISRLLPDGLSLHASRLPGMNQEDTSVGLRERFLGYNDTLAASAASFGGLPLDALLFACTGCSYLVGADQEDVLLDRLRAGGTQKVQTAAGALRHVLDSAGISTVAMVSPYPAWLTDAAVAYWANAGHAVTDVVAATEGSSIYAIRADEVLDAVARLDLSGVDAVVLTGTGMATTASIERAGGDFGVPLLSPNACAAWWLTHTAAPDSMPAASSVVRGINALVNVA